MIELDDEGVIKHRHDSLLVFYDILLLILADKALKHDLHGVELPVPQAANEIHLTKTANRQAFAYFVLFQAALRDVLETVEGSFPGEDALTYRDLIV